MSGNDQIHHDHHIGELPIVLSLIFDAPEPNFFKHFFSLLYPNSTADSHRLYSVVVITLDSDYFKSVDFQ